MEILYGVIFIFFGLNLIFFGGMMMSSVCSDAFICDLQYIDTGTLIFIGVLLIAGLVFLYIGIRKTWKNVATKRKGVERYGIVVECWEQRNANRQMGGQHYILKVLIIDDDDKIRVFKEFSAWYHNVGSFLIAKHYKDDINIIDKVSGDLVPEYLRGGLEYGYREYTKSIKDNANC